MINFIKRNYKKIIISCFSLLILFFAFYLIIPTDRFEKTEDIEWGVTYSNEYARDLGLDQRKVYEDMLNELPIKSIRIPAYWNEIEPEDNKFNFDDLDWQLQVAQEKEVSVLLSIGYKLPRWPECRKPDWLNNDRAQVKKQLKEMLEVVVNRYKGNETIIAWQVENEPFLPFGVCLDLGKDFLKEEVRLVKELDPSRNIVVTESGELSLWRKAPKSGADILGVTTYRVVWNPYIGKVSWFMLTPNYYRKKAQLISKSIKDFYFVELQAEPWGPDFITEMSEEQQLEVFSIKQLEKNINFGKKTGLRNTYLWGVEWWYYMRDIKGNQEVFDTVVELLK